MYKYDVTDKSSNEVYFTLNVFGKDYITSQLKLDNNLLLDPNSRHPKSNNFNNDIDRIPIGANNKLKGKTLEIYISAMNPGSTTFQLTLEGGIKTVVYPPITINNTSDKILIKFF